MSAPKIPILAVGAVLLLQAVHVSICHTPASPAAYCSVSPDHSKPSSNHISYSHLYLLCQSCKLDLTLIKHKNHDRSEKCGFCYSGPAAWNSIPAKNTSKTMRQRTQPCTVTQLVLHTTGSKQTVQTSLPKTSGLQIRRT